MSPSPHTAVLGAAGLVGQWVVRSLAAGGERIATVDQAGQVDVRADVTTPEPQLRAATAGAGRVVLALPEDTVLECLSWLAQAVPDDAVIVSTCSVQEPVFARAAKLGMQQEVLGLNPMFAPDLAPAGRPVVLVGQHPSAETGRLRAQLEGHGMVVEFMDPQTHDSTMSVLQALPHAAVLAFAAALAAQPLDVRALMRVAPPPFRVLIALACRILAAPPEVYWDIQQASSASAERRGDLRRSLDLLDSMVRDGSEAQFRAGLTAVAGWLGPCAQTGARECRRLFMALTEPDLS